MDFNNTKHTNEGWQELDTSSTLNVEWGSPSSRTDQPQNNVKKIRWISGRMLK